MVFMNKIFGNRMIDVQPSNNKLINRVMRLINEIWKDSNQLTACINDRQLYHEVTQVYEYKKVCNQKGMSTSSVVKILLTGIRLSLSLHLLLSLFSPHTCLSLSSPSLLPSLPLYLLPSLKKLLHNFFEIPHIHNSNISGNKYYIHGGILIYRPALIPNRSIH